MLTKEQILFPMNYAELPFINGYAVEIGERDGQVYTALWAEESESKHPDFFWLDKLPVIFLRGFTEGLRAGKDSGYKAGRARGIRLVQEGFSMVFGPVGRDYVQKVVAEMEKDGVR